MSKNEEKRISRAMCELHDANDSIRACRDRFDLPEHTIYLDGNSLGALPRRTPLRVNELLRNEWGESLIKSWNKHDWATFPQRVSMKLACLLGANASEVIIADSTSVNIFKLLAGALVLPDVESRRIIVSERGNFPTDLYMVEGVNAMLSGKYTLRLVEAGDVEASLDHDVAVALITHVDYCTGRQHNMARLNKRASQTGTHIIWDLSHSAGAVELELNADGAEMAVGCGYKYLNGGPGAPAFLYLAKALQSNFATPLSGWFGHQMPFAFSPTYVPAAGIERLLCGTPPVIALAALECGIDTFDGVTMDTIGKKSRALSELFLALMRQECGNHHLESVSPSAENARGSHISLAHEHAYPIMQALIDRGVIGDFRPPNLLRFGFAPLYTRFVDCYDAVIQLRDVMANGEWKAEKYQTRNRVT